MDEFNAVIESLGERIVVRYDNSLSNVLQSRFPFSLGRIDWRRVPDHRVLTAPRERLLGANSKDSLFDSERYVPTVEEFLLQSLNAHHIEDASIAVVSDSIEPEYEIDRSVLRDVLVATIWIPSHWYLFGLDGSWCCMWSMEDDVCFGVAPTMMSR